jgi:hypothetical protein
MFCKNLKNYGVNNELEFNKKYLYYSRKLLFYIVLMVIRNERNI